MNRRRTGLSIDALTMASALLLAAVVTMYWITAVPLLLGWRDTTIPEGCIVYSSQAVYGNRDVYRDYREPPYGTTPYGPLYYVAVGSLAQLFGGSLETTYLCGRNLSLSCFIITAVIVFIFALQTAGRAHAVLAALSMFAVPGFDRWTVTCRPDAVASCCSLLGVYFVARGRPTNTLFASLCFATALLIKQSTIAGLLAATVWLAISFQFRQAISLLLSTAILSLFGYACCYAVWGGALLENMFGANVAPIDLSSPAQVQYFFLMTACLPLFLAGVGVFADWNRGGGPTLQVWHLLMSLLVAQLLSVKAGADINYFLEPLAAAAVVSARGWHSVLTWRPSSKAKRWLTAVLLVLLIQSSVFQRVLKLNTSGTPARAPTSALKRWIDPEYHTALIGTSDLAIRSQPSPEILDLFNVSYLCDRGRINVRPIVDSIEQGKFDVVISPFPLSTTFQGVSYWPVPLRDAITERFAAKAGRIEGLFVYEYLPQQRSAQ